METIASRIRTVRQERKLTIAELCTLAGLHPTQLGQYERGGSEPKLGTVSRLATALGVKPAWLAFGDVYGPREGA